METVLTIVAVGMVACWLLTLALFAYVAFGSAIRKHLAGPDDDPDPE